MKTPPPPPLRSPEGNQIRLDGTLDPVRRIGVQISENGKNASPYDLNWTQRDRARDHIPCNNPNCFSGGFSIGDLLRELINGRQEEYIGTSFCTGHEGNPEESGPHPSCETRFEVQVRLHFT